MSALADLRDRYRGPLAEGYERHREGPQWDAEDAFVAQVMAEASGRVLDAPVGTGRFFRHYPPGAVGLDVSPDMMEQAAHRGWPEAALHPGSVLAMPFRDDSFDVGVCVRFLNWLDASELQVALEEFRRVVRGPLVVSLESGVRQGRTQPHPVASVEHAGWSVARSQVIHSRGGWTYAMHLLEPISEAP